MDSSEIAKVWSPQKEKDTPRRVENTRITPGKRSITYIPLYTSQPSNGILRREPSNKPKNGSGSTEISREQKRILDYVQEHKDSYSTRNTKGGSSNETSGSSSTSGSSNIIEVVAVVVVVYQIGS